MPLDIKFIRGDQKQYRNDEACRASLTCFWSSLIKLISKDTRFSIYHALLEDLVAKRQGNKFKAGAVLFELADVEKALRRKSVTSFSQSKCCYQGQHQ